MVASIAANTGSAASVNSGAGRPVLSGGAHPRKLEFLRDPSSGRVVLRSTDMVTGKVRHLPPQKMLSTMASIRRAIGLLLDRQI